MLKTSLIIFTLIGIVFFIKSNYFKSNDWTLMICDSVINNGLECYSNSFRQSGYNTLNECNIAGNDYLNKINLYNEKINNEKSGTFRELTPEDVIKAKITFNEATSKVVEEIYNFQQQVKKEKVKEFKISQAFECGNRCRPLNPYSTDKYPVLVCDEVCNRLGCSR